ncbi:MAG: CDP-archaeol synthase [Puniceicoccaceae bacterium]|nr:MAG: CDP-archaeol synthase [Puniceicoccaceae bacterium]
MIQRTLSTLGLWAGAIVLLVLFGPHAGVWLIAIFAAVTQHELYRMLERMGFRPFRRFGTLLGAGIILVPFYARLAAPELFERGGSEGAIVAVILVGCCLRVLKERTLENRVETLAATIFGVIYVPFMLQFIVRIFSLGETASAGMMLALWLIVAAKFCDVGALLVGSAIGRHKMSPTLSPKKTWEGTIGGVLVGALAGGLLAVFFSNSFPENFGFLKAFLIALPVCGVGVVSDLIESLIKRRAELKDSGSFIPGIGGAFDLTDSLILTAPVGYLLLNVFL